MIESFSQFFGSPFCDLFGKEVVQDKVKPFKNITKAKEDEQCSTFIICLRARVLRRSEQTRVE